MRQLYLFLTILFFSLLAPLLLGTNIISIFLHAFKIVYLFVIPVVRSFNSPSLSARSACVIFLQSSSMPFSGPFRFLCFGQILTIAFVIIPDLSEQVGPGRKRWLHDQTRWKYQNMEAPLVCFERPEFILLQNQQGSFNFWYWPSQSATTSFRPWSLSFMSNI